MVQQDSWSAAGVSRPSTSVSMLAAKEHTQESDEGVDDCLDEGEDDWKGCGGMLEALTRFTPNIESA